MKDDVDAMWDDFGDFDSERELRELWVREWKADELEAAGFDIGYLVGRPWSSVCLTYESEGRVEETKKLADKRALSRAELGLVFELWAS